VTRILIVEDDSTQVRVLARALSRRDAELSVMTSGDGLEATKLLGLHDFDLVITDLEMPRMDGFELLAWVLNNRPSVPVFAVTGFGSQETIERLTALGAVECFTKPLDVTALHRRVKDILAQAIRGHVEHVSLASFLQLVEMERKTCTLEVASNGNRGTLFVRMGQLYDARAGDLCGEAAAISIVAWNDPEITIASHCAIQDRTITAPLGFIVMEAMRVQDEALRDEGPVERASVLVWPDPNAPERPPSVVPESRLPPSSGPGAPLLPNGARAIALVDTATGVPRSWTSSEGTPLGDVAELAALVLRVEIALLRAFGEHGSIEELVLSTTTRCDVIRPMGAGAERFALLVFTPGETSLGMARIELDRFLGARP
jgi:DNA-binding response OmpR family regulator